MPPQLSKKQNLVKSLNLVNFVTEVDWSRLERLQIKMYKILVCGTF